ncbi:MAG: hypothetical protein HN403_04780 [Rhodospirillales bacterium]|jgi:hypothetical protein|nr:hypothetical protein [Rhodospirillales bacterium]
MGKRFASLVGSPAPLIALAAIIILSGCQTKYAGSGPLQISPAVSNYFQLYMNDSQRAALAVSLDGKCASYRFCSAVAGVCAEGDEAYFTKRGCESSCKKSCGVLAVGSTIVWDGPVTDSDGNDLN